MLLFLNPVKRRVKKSRRASAAAARKLAPAIFKFWDRRSKKEEPDGKRLVEQFPRDSCVMGWILGCDMI